MTERTESSYIDKIALRFAAITFMLCSQPVAAEEIANDNRSDQLESAQLGQPLNAATLESASDIPPKAKEEPSIFSEAYDFAKRSGIYISNNVKASQFSSANNNETPVPAISVQATPESATPAGEKPAFVQSAHVPEPSTTTQKPTKEYSWGDISGGATNLYERTIHTFDKDHSN